MNRKVLKKFNALAAAILLMLGVIGTAFGGAALTYAAGPTDRIDSYTITADVNEDATVDFTYEFSWAVLESDGIGPVSWVTIGIPNDHIENIRALSGNIDAISLSYDSGTFLLIDFNDSYYKGETIDFAFSFTDDYLYEMNTPQSGYTTYYFTPGWFGDIEVKKLTVRWNSKNLTSWSGNCLVMNGYNTWETSLDPGEYISLELVYPSDAFAFDSGKGYDSGYDYGGYDYGYDSGSSGLSLVLMLIPFLAVVIMVFAFVRAASAGRAYDKASGFSSGETKTKVTHTKVIYYDSCPGCGAPRAEGATVCEYCGRDLVKSEELIKEEEVKGEDKEALKYNKKGEYHYGSDPNTFVRVNVVHVPITPAVGIAPRSASGSKPRSSSRPKSGGGCAYRCSHGLWQRCG